MLTPGGDAVKESTGAFPRVILAEGEYRVIARSDDELLRFDNVVLSPHIAAQPRFNALNDLADMMERLAKELAP